MKRIDVMIIVILIFTETHTIFLAWPAVIHSKNMAIVIVQKWKNYTQMITILLVHMMIIMTTIMYFIMIIAMKVANMP